MPELSYDFHVAAISAELKWLKDIAFFQTSKSTFREEKPERYSYDLTDQPGLFERFPAPDLREGLSPYSQFLGAAEVQSLERLLLILALSPHIQPDLVGHLFNTLSTKAEKHPEFGLARGALFPGYLPTGQTFVFLAGAYDLDSRLKAMQLFHQDHLLGREGIVQLEPHYKGEPTLSGRLVVPELWVDRLLLGRELPEWATVKYRTELITGQKAENE